MIKRLKAKLLNLVVKRLFNGITTDDVIMVTPNGLYIGGQPLSTTEIQTLRAEAKLLKGLEIWKLITKQAKATANQQMYEKSSNWDGMFFGKACLYIVSVQEDIIENLTK